MSCSRSTQHLVPKTSSPSHHSTGGSCDNIGHTDLLSKDDSHSPACFKTPARQPAPAGSRKWKALLARLRLRPSKPCTISASRRNSRSAASPSSSASTCALPSALPPGDAWTKTIAAMIDPSLITLPDSYPFSVDVANDVEKLLHIFLKSPSPEDIRKRTSVLTALCALCVSSPNHAKRCIVAGGVQVIIDVLNSTAESTSDALQSRAAMMDENEKALLLLEILITSSSADACIAVLRSSTSIIPTLGKKLLRSSESCTASAIIVLTSLCRHSDTILFHKAVSETSIPSKLVVVLQVASEESTKRKAGRLLRLLTEPQQILSNQ